MANPNTRVVLDLVRDTNTIIDLKPYFQGRVGDSNSFLPMAIVQDGVAADLTGKDVVFQGNDPQGTPITVYGRAEQAMHGDSWKRGRLTFYFPAETFQVPGEWDSAFFRVVDATKNEQSGLGNPLKSTSIVSSLNVRLNVLEDDVDMVVTRRAYNTYAENALDDFRDYIHEKMDKVDNVTNGLSTNYPQLVAEYQTLKALDNQVKQMMQEKQVATLSDLGYNIIENDMGNVPTPQSFVNKGFYRTRWAYANIGDLNIEPGVTVDSKKCDTTAAIRSVVLNGTVIQTAMVTADNYVYMLNRRSTGDTTWSDWHLVTQF